MIENVTIFIINIFATLTRATLLLLLISVIDKKTLDLSKMGKYYYKILILVAMYYFLFYGFLRSTLLLTLMCCIFFSYYYYLMGLFSENLKSGLLTYALISIFTYPLVKIVVEVVLYYKMITDFAFIPILYEVVFCIQYLLLMFLFLNVKVQNHKKYFEKLIKKFAVVLYLYLFVEVILTLLGTSENFAELFFVIGNSYYFIPFALLVFLMIIIYQMNYFITLTNHLEDQVHMQKYYVSSIEELYDDVRHYKHDVNNMLLPIGIYLREDDYDSLKKYYKEHFSSHGILDVDLYHVLSHLRNLKVPELKGLILSKYQWAKQCNLKFNISIDDEIDCFEMNIVDICRVIGILLDNAIEAAQDLDAGYVNLIMCKSDDKIKIEIANNYDYRMISTKGKKMISLKGENRGIGLRSLKFVMNKYIGNSLKTVMDKDEYRQILFID